MNQILIKAKRFRLLRLPACILAIALLTSAASTSPAIGATPMTDTGQSKCYSNSGAMTCPTQGQRFFGQDANYTSTPMAYRDNGDGTVTDLVTGLVWSQAVDAKKVSLIQAEKMAKTMTLGGYSDWRVPSIKELYSLINFTGNTGNFRPAGSGNAGSGNAGAGAIPYINTDYFNFKYGNVKTGERYIDAQWLSSTRYVYYTMNRNPTLFGVNFADGRIKGYGYGNNGPRGEKKFYVRFVRGNTYGQNLFQANENRTVTDQATSLTWMQKDSGKAMTWEEALVYAETSSYGGYTDWRLPNAKELQYIVDYTRSPDTTDSAAIAPVFSATPVTNEAGQKDFAHYWTSTSHLDGRRPGDAAVTVCFGRAMGQMRGQTMDVHGAGAQRSDPKTGKSGIGHGPQGDARHSKNLVRLVRGGNVSVAVQSAYADRSRYPFVVKVDKGYEATASGSGSQGFNGQAGGSGQFGSNPFGSGNSQGRPGFVSRLDRDGDNRVSKSEFDGPSQHFSRLDRNNDGYLSEDEAPSGPPPGGKKP